LTDHVTLNSQSESLLTDHSCLVIIDGFHDCRMTAGDGQRPLLVPPLLRAPVPVLAHLLDDGLGRARLEDGGGDGTRAADSTR